MDEPRLGEGAVVALLLAAGESRRMGRPKPLLEWAGRTLVEYQIEELLSAGAHEVIVVLGARADEVRPLAERAGARVALNPHYHEGRAGSIRAGAGAIRGRPSAIVLLNVDQPRGRRITARLLRAHQAASQLITVPAYLGKRGHPVVVSGALLDELRHVDEASEGLRAVMRRHASERVELPFDDPDILLDFNHPADYEAARASMGRQSTSRNPFRPSP